MLDQMLYLLWEPHVKILAGPKKFENTKLLKLIILSLDIAFAKLFEFPMGETNLKVIISK